MKELQDLIKRVEVEINKTPTGELRNLLCDTNILLQKQALILPVVSKSFYCMGSNYYDGFNNVECEKQCDMCKSTQ